MNTNDISVSSTRKMDPDVEDYIKGQREELRKMIPGFVNDEAYIDVILNFHEKGIRLGIEKGLQMTKEQILKDAMDAAKFSCGHVRKLDEIQPIPLTSELLEKNGFERVPQPGCANPYHWMLEKYEEESDGLLFRIKAFNNPFRGMFVSIDNPSACETISFGKQIEFVHELRHALRICEIELDIKLEG